VPGPWNDIGSFDIENDPDAPKPKSKTDESSEESKLWQVLKYTVFLKFTLLKLGIDYLQQLNSPETTTPKKPESEGSELLAEDLPPHKYFRDLLTKDGGYLDEVSRLVNNDKIGLKKKSAQRDPVVASHLYRLGKAYSKRIVNKGKGFSQDERNALKESIEDMTLLVSLYRKAMVASHDKDTRTPKTDAEDIIQLANNDIRTFNTNAKDFIELANKVLNDRDKLPDGHDWGRIGNLMLKTVAAMAVGVMVTAAVLTALIMINNPIGWTIASIPLLVFWTACAAYISKNILSFGNHQAKRLTHCGLFTGGDIRGPRLRTTDAIIAMRNSLATQGKVEELSLLTDVDLGAPSVYGLLDSSDVGGEGTYTQRGHLVSESEESVKEEDSESSVAGDLYYYNSSSSS